MSYITHAPTPEALKAELISDLNRRLAMLDNQRKVPGLGELQKARIGRAIIELEDMLHYWTELEIVRPQRKRNRHTG
jgi:hypothetical protein